MGKWFNFVKLCGISLIMNVGIAVNVFAGSWERDTKGWWYDNQDGTYPSSSWSYIDREWYYFNEEGYIVTGWQNILGEWYYFYSDGSMAYNTWIDGSYYVDQDGKWVNSSSQRNYTNEELWKKITEVSSGKLAEVPFIADFNGDGRNEMILQGSEDSTESERIWSLFYWYTDGENTYKFGNMNLSGWLYTTEYSVIPTANGLDLVVNLGWHPMAFGGYMNSAYIYRFTADGAIEMFNRECCRLEEPQYESIRVINYEPSMGMTEVKGKETVRANGYEYK